MTYAVPAATAQPSYSVAPQAQAAPAGGPAQTGALENRLDRLETELKALAGVVGQLVQRLQKSTSAAPEATAGSLVPSVLSQAQANPAVTTQAAPARVTIHLPASARLFVDNVPFNANSATRSFETPKLEPGRQYFYTLRADIDRDGRTQRESRRVVLTAGQHVEVTFGAAPALQTVSR